MDAAWVVTIAMPIRRAGRDQSIIGVLCARWAVDELNGMTQLGRERAGTDAPLSIVASGSRSTNKS